MKCVNVRNKLHEFAKKELSAAESKDIGLHLESCENCMSLFESMETASGELLKIEVPDPGEDYFDRTRSHILETIGSKKLSLGETFAPRLSALFSKKGFAYAAPIAVLLAIIFIFNSNRVDYENMTVALDEIASYSYGYDTDFYEEDIETYKAAHMAVTLENELDGNKAEALEEYITFRLAENTYNSDILEYDLEGLTEDEFESLLTIMKEI